MKVTVLLWNCIDSDMSGGFKKQIIPRFMKRKINL